MRSKLTPRLLTLLTSTALLLAALAAGAPAAPAAPPAKKCPKGKTAWKLEGRSVCLGGKLPGRAGADGAAMAELWLRDASRRARGGKPRLSPALRSAVPKAGALLAEELGKVGAGAGASGARISSAGGGASRGPVVEHYDGVIARQQLGDGVVAEGRVRATVYEDYSHEAEIEISIRDRKGNAMLYAPDYSSLFSPEDKVECPSAGGLVTVEVKGAIGGTVTQLKGKRVVASKTASQSWRIRARGQVGSDARLHSVAADVTLSMKNFERGFQEETTVGASAALPRQGAPKATGLPTASVKVRAAGASRAEERAYEEGSVRALAGSAELAESLAEIANHSRKRLLDAEPSWYALPNDCARIAWAPEPGGTLQPGETRRVSGTVIARRDGGQASGRIDLSGVSRGRVFPVSASFTAAAPASFTAAAADPDASGLTVHATAVATSTAGRAQASWSARGTAVEPPRAFVGTIASISETAGLIRTFAGSATYTRTSLVRGPDGSLTAWYELTAASLGKARETLGPASGCRWEANGTNGNIESGDLELRVLPDGRVVYAFLYDIKVPSQFVPTDCPPDQFGFGGEITVFLNSGRPGPAESRLRPAGEGFELSAAGVGDVTAERGVTTVASWTLMPAE